MPAQPLEDQIVKEVSSYLKVNIVSKLLKSPSVVVIQSATKTVNQICSKPVNVIDLVERIDIAPGSIRFTLNQIALRELVEIDITEVCSDALVFQLPFQTRKWGVETKLIIGHVAPEKDEALIRNLAKAHKWLSLIKTGTSLDAIVEQETTSRRRIQQIIDFAFLAPDIVQMIVDGHQPIGLTSEWLLRHKLPSDWQDQRALVATL